MFCHYVLSMAIVAAGGIAGNKCVYHFFKFQPLRLSNGMLTYWAPRIGKAVSARLLADLRFEVKKISNHE